MKINLNKEYAFIDIVISLLPSFLFFVIAGVADTKHGWFIILFIVLGIFVCCIPLEYCEK